MYPSSYIKLPATLDNLSSFIDVVSNCAEISGMDRKRIIEIEIATEEALVNIIQYAYKGQKGDIEMECKPMNGSLMVKIVDYGMPFNILTIQDPDIKASVEERKIGGLGILLMKRLIDKIEYHREDDKNILLFMAYKDHLIQVDTLTT